MFKDLSLIRYRMNNITALNVFDSWNEYQMKILFNGWETTRPWQFILSCIGVVSFGVILNLLVLLRTYIKNKIYESNITLFNTYNEGENIKLIHKRKETNSICGWKVLYFFISLGFYVSFGLIQLILTTYNPWLFISVVLGYSIGDIITVNKIINLNIERKYY